MDILYSKGNEQDISRLDQAWEDPATFIFLSERSGVSRDWPVQAASRFPLKFQTGHFALLTSGSTGHYKIVVGVRQRAEALARAIHQVQDNEICEETILALPLTYCFSLVNQWLWAKVFNRRFVYTPGFSSPDVLQQALLKANNAMICLVAPQVPLMLKYFGENCSFDGVVRVHFAGGVFPQDKMDTVHKFFPKAQIFNNYGCTEAMPRLTVRREEESDIAHNVGRPLPQIKMKTDELGRILFSSPYAAAAYYDQEGFFDLPGDGWTPSGDFGEEDKAGYWYIKGRTDEIFKRFGEKISIPQLLETVKDHWKGEAVFYREKEGSNQEGHVLVVSPHPEGDEYRAILNAFRKNYPRAHWPLRLESVESVPLLANGKVDKLTIAAMQDKTIHWHQRI